MEKERLVVGAGPSGLSAAINLAKRGSRVRVRERHAAPGFRHHGFQGIENWSRDEDAQSVLRNLGIEPDFLLRPVKEVLYYGPKRHEFLVRSPGPLFYLVRRGNHEDALDRKLVLQAERLGVEISYNSPVESAPPGTIVGIGPTSAMAIAKGITFKTDAPDLALCIIDPDIAPKAYAYLLTHEGDATLAVMLTEDFKNVNSYLSQAIRAFRHIRYFSIQDEVEFGGVGGVDLSGKCLVNGHLRVGECSGAQDALWGFGLWFAFESGYLAAKCVAEGANYERTFRKTLLKRMRRLLVCRWLFDKISPNRYESYIKSFANLPDARRKLRKMYREGLWLNLLFPLASRHFTRSLREKRCHTEGCDCIWCRCGRRELLVPKLSTSSAIRS